MTRFDESNFRGLYTLALIGGYLKNAQELADGSYECTLLGYDEPITMSRPELTAWLHAAHVVKTESETREREREIRGVTYNFKEIVELFHVAKRNGCIKDFTVERGHRIISEEMPFRDRAGSKMTLDGEAGYYYALGLLDGSSAKKRWKYLDTEQN